MRNWRKMNLICGGIALIVILALGACNPATKSGKEASDKEVVAKEQETTTETDGSIKEDRESSPIDSNPDGNVDLPNYLPTDFPLPDDVEIIMSNSEQNEGKKYAFLTIRTKEDIETITSMYTTYFEGRKLEDAAQVLDAKNIIIQGESPTNSEYWSMIGGPMESLDGDIELIITWEEI